MFFQCHNVQVRYGRTVVLDLEELVIPDGRITGIVGPNGAGKTTLLEVMALLRRPTHGRVSLWGQPARRADRRLQRKVVMVMHAGYMFHGSVLDNVLFGLKARGLARTQARLRAAEALEVVELSEFSRRDASGLSAGQRQRVNLARAIAIQPRAILLDEPSANVDARTVDIICSLLRRLRDQRATTIVHTCPANGQLHNISDQLVELTDGQLRGNNKRAD
ncbi:MAG: ATP-binding cassette domain-containing protein [Actinobacteria bacterium]|nr:ATP-binding cassette domain-containing protein [Actinomycetota bacterium]